MPTGNWLAISGDSKEHIVSAWGGATNAEFTTWSGGLSVGSGVEWQYLLDTDPLFPAASGTPGNYLWDVIASGIVPKKTVTYTVGSALIEPGSSTTVSYSVTGGLFEDLEEDAADIITIQRVMTTTISGQYQYSNFFQPDPLATISGNDITLASGVEGTFNFAIPGSYFLVAVDNNSYWNINGTEVVVSGENRPNFFSYNEQVGTWKLEKNGANEWDILQSTDPALTSINGLVGTDLEGGTLYLHPGSNITLLGADGITTEVDLVGADGSLDIVASGTNSEVNLKALGTGSSVNLEADGGNVNLLSNKSDVNLTADLGDINLIGVLGDVNLTTDLSDINLTTVDGFLTLNANSSPMAFNAWGGENITIDVNGADLIIDVQNGVVNMQEVDRGLQLPTLTNAQKAGLSSVVQGTTIFNTSSGTVNVYDGSSWRTLAYA